MDFDAMAYPDVFIVGGVQHKGQRNRDKGEVLIPYTTAPAVKIGDRILQRNGPNTIEL